MSTLQEVLDGTARFAVVCGDATDVLKSLPADTFHVCYCDPPYGLSAHDTDDVLACLRAWLAGTVYTHHGAGFMGKDWDAFVPGPEVWREVYRALKPGAYCVAYSSTRTVDLLGISMRIAGGDIREGWSWITGQGFPKSLDVSKAIGKSGGKSPSDTAQWLREQRESAGLSRADVANHVGCTEASVRDWEEGRARATGKALEFMVPSDEYRAKLEVLFGYPSDKRDIVGSSVDRRGDGTLYKVGMSGTLRGAGDTDAAKQWSGYGTTTKPAYEPLVVTRKPLDGTVANNVLKHGTGALNIDGARVGTGDNLNGGAYAKEGTARHDGDENWRFKRDGGAGEYVQPSGRFPANLALVHDEGCERVGAETVDEWQCTDTCAVAELSRQSTGTAARFFYQGKATARDRLAYLTCSPACPAHGTVAPATTAPSKGSPCPRCGKPVEVYQHPTVKPYELALYHAKLLSLPPHTRPVALVPFCGTGVEARALMDVGYRVIAVDLDPRHCAMTSYRLGGEQPAREARVEPETTAPPAPLTLDDLLGF